MHKRTRSHPAVVSGSQVKQTAQVAVEGIPLIPKLTSVDCSDADTTMNTEVNPEDPAEGGDMHNIEIDHAAHPPAQRDYYQELYDALSRGEELFQVRLPPVHSMDEGAARDDMPDDSPIPFAAQQAGIENSYFLSLLT
jgi:hypothetical protein